MSEQKYIVEYPCGYVSYSEYLFRHIHGNCDNGQCFAMPRLICGHTLDGQVCMQNPGHADFHLSKGFVWSGLTKSPRCCFGGCANLMCDEDAGGDCVSTENADHHLFIDLDGNPVKAEEAKPRVARDMMHGVPYVILPPGQETEKRPPDFFDGIEVTMRDAIQERLVRVSADALVRFTNGLVKVDWSVSDQREYERLSRELARALGRNGDR